MYQCLAPTSFISLRQNDLKNPHRRHRAWVCQTNKWNLIRWLWLSGGNLLSYETPLVDDGEPKPWTSAILKPLKPLRLDSAAAHRQRRPAMLSFFFLFLFCAYSLKQLGASLASISSIRRAVNRLAIDLLQLQFLNLGIDSQRMIDGDEEAF